MKAQHIFTALWWLCGVYTLPLAAQQSLNFTVKAGGIKTLVAPGMWGIFFEDINLGADGGIYAELVKNRSFEFSTPLMGWSIPRETASNGGVLVVNRHETNAANPRFVRVTVLDTRKFVLANDGFRGMGIRAGSSITSPYMPVSRAAAR